MEFLSIEVAEELPIDLEHSHVALNSLEGFKHSTIKNSTDSELFKLCYIISP